MINIQGIIRKIKIWLGIDIRPKDTFHLSGDYIRMKYIAELIHFIEEEITLDFYRDLKHVDWTDKTCIAKLHPKGFYRSCVTYQGKSMCVAYFDCRQIPEALYKLASHFYKEKK